MAKKYSKEFKQSAVEMVLQGDRSRRAIARSLGVNYHTLKDWIRDLGPVPGEDPEIPDDVGKLKKELAELRLENEILKKYAAILVKDR